MKLLVGAIAALCLIGLGQARAAEVQQLAYAWHNVRIGGGGFTPGVLYSSAEKGLAYLRTDVGGAYRWDEALQTWVPLQDAIWQDSYLGVESLAPDPINPDIVYLAGGMYSSLPSAILRSSDRGRTWTIVPAPFAMGGNEDGRGLGERLAIDPNRSSTLFFGSRHDGLWRSDDSAASWTKVASFPLPGLGAPQPRHSHGGIAFVILDPTSGALGAGSKTIFAGVADPGPNHLFRSDDGGQHWQLVPGGPNAALLPVKAAVDSRGFLYVDYCDGIGPSGITDGAVWKLDIRSGRWTDISPTRGSEQEGGYMGLSLDRQHPGRLAVSTVDRWAHRDTIWVSNDGGSHWSSLRERSSSDVSATPYVRFGAPEAPFGHWISGLAIDPFDGGTLAYTTGVTVYRTEDGLRSQLLWKPWVEGMEETVPLSLVSPTGGAHLVSGIGDVHGFVHDRLDASPERAIAPPDFPNTNQLDFAGAAPAILVRSASDYQPDPDGASLAWSDNGGRDWTLLKTPPAIGPDGKSARMDTNGEVPITVSADGGTFVVSGPAMLATSDRGKNWWRPKGVPRGARAIADKADGQAWYAIDYSGGHLFVSRDGAHSFKPVPATGLPADISDVRPRNRESPPYAIARPGHAGELWFMSGGRLYRSTDFGSNFSTKTPVDLTFANFGLGKEAPKSSFPTLFAFAVTKTWGGILRSTDGGASWLRINDDDHQWGLRFRTMTGDPRLFGRIYVGTDGRGIFYGDPAPSKDLR